jgi:hypothetical protein
MAARLSALRAGRILPPGFFIFKDSWYSFLLEAESTLGPVRPEALGQFKNPLINNWVSRDSAVGIATGYGLDNWEAGVSTGWLAIR